LTVHSFDLISTDERISPSSIDKWVDVSK
jgi:hypothetical protein